MNPFFSSLLANRVLWVTLLAWFIAQTIKVVAGVIRTKKFDFRWFVGTGGMPSSHASGATALATNCGLYLGFDSAFFALAVVFAIVTMFDAQGVRRSAGKQAQILNKIMDDIYWRGKIAESRLFELIGHTPFEVLVGAVLGFIISMSFYFW